MRVLHVLDHSVPHPTEYAARARAVVRGVCDLGADVLQLTGPRHGDSQVRDETIEGRVYYRTPPVRTPLSDVAVLGDFELVGEIAHRIEQVARRAHPHLLHVHSPVLNALAALRVGRRIGLPVLYDVHGLWRDESDASAVPGVSAIRRRVLRAMSTFAARHAAHVITAGQGAADELVRRGVASDSVTAVIGGADDEEADPAPAVELRSRLGLADVPVVGYVGRVLECEGVSLLLDAFEILRAARPEARLLVAGDGPARGRVEAAAAVARAGVMFVPCTSLEEERSYYRVVDVLVCPRIPGDLAEREVPLRLCAALGDGATVLASDVAGQREIVSDRLVAATFRAGDSRDLAARMAELLASASTRASLATHGRALAARALRWSGVAQRYGRIYERVLATTSQAA